MNDITQKFDHDIWDAISREQIRQEEHIELIASENYSSNEVMRAQGSELTNKYAEGYPSKRYDGGCEHIDTGEALAIERAKTLFDAGYANVQPNSGSQANAAVFMALMNPWDTILGLSLDHGGHLTHGAKPNFSGKIYNAVQYGIDTTTGELNYNDIQALADQHKPKLIVAGLVATGLYPNPVSYADAVTTTTHKTLRGPLMHVIAAKAIALREALQSKFKIYQKQVIKNAQAMAKIFMENGYEVIAKGTDNHLFPVYK